MGEKRNKIQDVFEQTGLSRATISNLYHDKMQRIDYETLGKLCKLFGCTVGDILEYVDDIESIL
jgi:putative transcriptional regulator